MTAAPAPPAAVENNFHLLRLVLAFLVVVHHLVVLPHIVMSTVIRDLAGAGAEIGVQGFFVLSGYLVYGSFERSGSLALYAEKRVRRLYPAYAAVVLLTALVLVIATPAAWSQLGQVARYLAANLVFLNFLEPELPGVFQNNHFPEINGALWTLKIEVMFYLALPVLAVVLRLAGKWKWAVIAGLYVAAEMWRFGLEYIAAQQQSEFIASIARQLPGQVNFFITGVAFYLLRDRLDWRSQLAGAGLVILAASFLTPFAEPIRAVGLGITLLWLATGVQLPFNAARFGDLSYGLYIVHFPVIQAFVAAGLFGVSLWLGAAAAIATSLVLALLLWRFVERPFLRSDSAYRRSPNPASRDAG